jgi:ubiquinone/menaquinone biosynthesis C-methylase UbiE
MKLPRKNKHHILMATINDVISEYHSKNEAHYACSRPVLEQDFNQLNRRLNNNATQYYHDRLLEPLKSLSVTFPGASWLTLGDGALGRQAYYLQKLGFDVTASDIDDMLLQHLQKLGLLKKVSRQDAEKITYDNQSFDFVLCKNTLHHLARPYLGIYEMLRVARKAVIIMEPQDPKINEDLKTQADGAFEEFQALKFGNNDFFFEKCGNYIYRLSQRELEKVALGLGRNKIAFRGINEIDFPDDIDGNNQKLLEVAQQLALKDMLSLNGYRRFEVAMCIIFVDNLVPSEVDRALAGDGWEIRNLPKNPYLDCLSK